MYEKDTHVPLHIMIAAKCGEGERGSEERILVCSDATEKIKLEVHVLSIY